VKILRWFLNGTGALILAGTLLSCASTASKPEAQGSKTLAVATRDNCYGLLYQLLSDEKGVKLLHYIKKEDAGLKELIQKISTVAGAGVDRLDAFSKEDPSLPLEDQALPVGEQATRDDIGKQKEHELLTQKGNKFEITLLLTQVEALNYASHLAKVASDNDMVAERRDYLASLSTQMQELRSEVVAKLVEVARKGENGG
jgi:hypothetical protein